MPPTHFAARLSAGSAEGDPERGSRGRAPTDCGVADWDRQDGNLLPNSSDNGETPHGDRERAGLVLAHRDELIEQAVDKLPRAVPDVEVGVVKVERDEHTASLIVASVQTLPAPSSPPSHGA